MESNLGNGLYWKRRRAVAMTKTHYALAATHAPAGASNRSLTLDADAFSSFCLA